MASAFTLSASATRGSGGSIPTTASDTSAMGSSGASAPLEENVGRFCSSLEEREPEDVIVVGLHGASLGFLRASGDITVTEPLIEGSMPTLKVSSNHEYAAVYSIEVVSDAVELELALYEFEKGLLWSQELTGQGLFSLLVGDDGRVTLNAAGEDLTIDLDGKVMTAPEDPVPSATPDVDGWILAEFDPPAGETIPAPGFENVETGEVRYLTYEDLSSGQFPVRVETAYYYFASVDGDVVLVRETSSEVELVETSLPVSTEQSFRNDGDWFWVYESRVPAWRYSAAEEVAEAIPFLEPSGGEAFATHLSTDFVLVSEGGSPRYSVDLSALELMEHSDPGVFDTWQVATAGPWFLGIGQDGPHWRVNAQKGTSESIDLSDILEGRTDWPVASCGDDPQSRAISVHLRDDGSFGMALRDDTQAAYFLGSFDLSEWTQLGGAFADVQEIQAWQHGPTWLVAARYTESEHLFCPFVGDSPFLSTAESDALIRGNAFQFVPPNPDHIVVLEGYPYPAHFHESGLCVAREDHLYDLDRGTSIELGFNAQHWFAPVD